MKEVKKESIEKLIKEKVIRNTYRGFVNKFGDAIGFYRTRNKRYIEDKYADIAMKLEFKNNKQRADFFG